MCCPSPALISVACYLLRNALHSLITTRVFLCVLTSRLSYIYARSCCGVLAMSRAHTRVKAMHERQCPIVMGSDRNLQRALPLDGRGQLRTSVRTPRRNRESRRARRRPALTLVDLDYPSTHQLRTLNQRAPETQAVKRRAIKPCRPCSNPMSLGPAPEANSSRPKQVHPA